MIDPVTGCWNWTGPTSGEGRGGGYGRMSLDGQTVAVHLVTFTHFHGYIPGKKQIDHICENRRCCNPDHLELVSVTRKGRANIPMNGMVRAALSNALESALSDNVIEYGAGPVKSIRVGFQAAVRRAGIGHVRIHDIRHTAAVTMLSAGVPLDKVSQYLGHSNTATTFKVYARYLPGHMQDAADVLDFTSLSKRKTK